MKATKTDKKPKRRSTRPGRGALFVVIDKSDIPIDQLMAPWQIIDFGQLNEAVVVRGKAVRIPIGGQSALDMEQLLRLISQHLGSENASVLEDRRGGVLYVLGKRLLEGVDLGPILDD